MVFHRTPKLVGDVAFDEVAKRPMIAGLSTEVKVITSDGCK